MLTAATEGASHTTDQQQVEATQQGSVMDTISKFEKSAATIEGGDNEGLAGYYPGLTDNDAKVCLAYTE